MPRPPKYSDAEIVNIVSILLGEGKEINTTRVRQRLGGGNLKRIQRLLDAWEPPEPSPEDMNFAGVNSDDPASDIFQKHIGEFANKCWNAAITTTGERFKAERAKYKEQAASLRAEVSALKNN